MIDVPCGGMVWMPSVLEAIAKTKPSFRYLGLDIARTVVDGLKVNFADRPNWCAPGAPLMGCTRQAVAAGVANPTGSSICWAGARAVPHGLALTFGPLLCPVQAGSLTRWT